MVIESPSFDTTPIQPTIIHVPTQPLILPAPTERSVSPRPPSVVQIRGRSRSRSPSPRRPRSFVPSTRSPSPIPIIIPPPQPACFAPSPFPPTCIAPSPGPCFAPTPQPAWPSYPMPPKPQVDILTFHFNKNMAYAPAAKTYEEAIDNVVELWPELRDVERSRIKLLVTGLDHLVRVPKMSWEAVLHDLPRYEVVHVQVDEIPPPPKYQSKRNSFGGGKDEKGSHKRGLFSSIRAMFS